MSTGDPYQHTAYISIGSNMGNKLLNCQNGIAALPKSGKSVLKARSRFYKTEPVDYTDQDWFINAMVKIETSLDPFQLFNELKSIEQAAGRTCDIVRFGPRVLDLDIILYDDQVIETPQLTVPHPRMHERRFVLQPLCDMDPGVVHPVLKKEARQLLTPFNDDEQRIVPCSFDF